MKKLSSGEIAIIGVVLFVGAGFFNSLFLGLVATGVWIWALVKWLNKGE